MNSIKKQSYTYREKNRKGEFENKKIPLFIKDDKVSGKIDIKLDRKKKLNHMGIRIELVGLIEIYSDGEKGSTFMCNGIDLEPSGTLYNDKTYDFSFDIFQKPFDSYYGKTVKLRYLIRCSIQKSGMSSSIKKEIDLGVLTCKERQKSEPIPINMEVGIDEFLNIKIEIPRKLYHLKDLLIGKISFSTVKVLIKKMELNIVKKEIIGIGQNSQTTSEEINSFEIMDGCPIKGKIIRRRDPH